MSARHLVAGDDVPHVGAGRMTQLLTAEQLADRWQVSQKHVYRLARSGQIPVVMIGRYQRFRLEAIEEWERAR